MCGPFAGKRNSEKYDDHINASFDYNLTTIYSKKEMRQIGVVVVGCSFAWGTGLRPADSVMKV